MGPTLIWDLPTRVLHWVLAAGFGVAAGLALGLDEHDPLFAYHGLAGLVLAAVVVLRIGWGLVGTRHARFESFAFGPFTAIGYVWKTVFGGARRYAGHNPGTAYAMIAMFALLGVLAVTGVMMGTGIKDVKEVHEVCAYAMLAVVGAHIAGIAWHTIRHRENIAVGMIHGRKWTDPAEGIRSSRPLAAAAIVAVLLVLTVSLVRGYDPSTRTEVVPLIGTSLRLGDAERGGDERGHEHSGSGERGS